MAACSRSDALGIFDERLRDRDAHELDVLRRREPGLHGTEGDEGPHHQSRGNQQDQRERDLQDHQRVPGPMPLAAAAGAASAPPQCRPDLRSAMPEDGDDAEQESGPNRDDQRESDDRGIDRDVAEPWQRRRPDQHEEPQRGEGEPKPQDAARERQDEAFDETLARDAAPAGAQRGANRELVLTSFGADQQQIGHVGARDQEHQANRREQDPQHVADAADDRLRQRHERGREAHAGKELAVEPWRRGPLVQPDGDQAREIGVGLRQA